MHRTQQWQRMCHRKALLLIRKQQIRGSSHSSRRVQAAEQIPPISANISSEPIVPELIPEAAPSTDPVLEEAPRISAQELANMAPPAVDLLRDFQGFLREVPSGDAQSSNFRYQLETRSGRRIVYLDIKNLLHTGFDSMIDQWISIKGLLSELPPDNVLYLDARNIRKDS